MAKRSPSALKIKQGRVLLRDFETGDEAAVQRYAANPRVTRYLWWGPNSLAQTQAFLAKARKNAARAPRQHFELAIVEQSSGEVIGGCELQLRRSAYREYEMGYQLAEERWARGLARDALLALTRLAFEDLGAHRVYGLVDPENPASAHLLETSGYRWEGRFRRDCLIAGAWRDSVVYAQLYEDWDTSGPASSKRSLELELLAPRFALCRCAPRDDVPEWAIEGAMHSVTRTSDELSILCEESQIPADVTRVGNRRVLKVRGPLAFSEVGVLESLARPLARASVPLLAFSTYDTDYLVMADEDLERVNMALQAAGHRLGEAETPV